MATGVVTGYSERRFQSEVTRLETKQRAERGRDIGDARRAVLGFVVASSEAARIAKLVAAGEVHPNDLYFANELTDRWFRAMVRESGAGTARAVAAKLRSTRAKQASG